MSTYVLGIDNAGTDPLHALVFEPSSAAVLDVPPKAVAKADIVVAEVEPDFAI